MAGKRPTMQLRTLAGVKRPPPAATGYTPRCGSIKGRRVQAETAAATSQHRAEEKVTVAVDSDLLQCCVCSGPLTPPLFQCTKGHISCSACCTDCTDYDVDEFECLMCREPETATRCRAMERLLAGLSVACPFREHGCAEMIPYADKQAHKASCAHAPRYCPIAGCAGYAGQSSLSDHVLQDHAVQRTRVRHGSLTPLRMSRLEPARVLWLDCGGEFLLTVGDDVPSGRSLSMLGFMDTLDDEFKYKIEVVGKAGVLSLSGQVEGVERLSKPYQASAFLYVPNAIWDSSPEDIPVFIELK
ncbi:hypothetical protein BS78_03G083000 [Paspalum vaginatum]|nr:hypothetical protein BS78_03G083000 [Paspalum vaginatum]KAJ1282843.1 hypothetical protein BS78_03G083000 [Paspalum vaginatum]